MLYVTGIHALNLPCSLRTCGDWHTSSLRWQDIMYKDSERSLFGDYGIEYGKKIPGHSGTYAVANHIRALLDLLEMGFYASAQGMNRDFICNDEYTYEIFEKVGMMKDLNNWLEIDRFMVKEYFHEWLKFKKKM